MDRMNLAVVFGGVSSEHDISLLSATTIIRSLNREKYNLFLIGITKEGQFLSYTGNIDKIANGEWENQTDCLCNCIISPSREHHGMILMKNGVYKVIRLDCVIPALHGKNGEDGTIQGLFQLAGIPFVGCDTISSANCMDKEMAHIILQNAGIRMAKWTVVHKDISQQELKTVIESIEQQLSYPVFLKPANAGSSIGVSKAHNRMELIEGLKLGFQHDKKVIVEETIIGREIECAVLGNRDAKASYPGEIEPANEFYDFDAKYVQEDSKLHIPARIDPSTMEHLRDTAVRAFLAIGCEGLARVDFFVTQQNEVILNEINTLPGFTSISMYPKMWEKTGIPISQLLDLLIQYAMSR
jgi:D-alanine-D-alanine ligase